MRTATKQSGFMLIQTLAGIAVFSVVVAIVAAFFDWANASEKFAVALNDFNQTARFAQLASDDPAACTRNFRGLSLAAGFSARQVSVSIYNQAGVAVQPVAVQGMNFGAARVTSVRLLPKAQIGALQYIAELEITGEKVGDVLGSSAMVRRFPLLAKTDAAGAIVSCSGSYSAGGMSNFEQKVCDLISGGQHYFDVNVNSCAPRYQPRWFPGNQSTATCGPGSTRALDCRGVNFVDPGLQTRTRTYLGGRIATADGPGPVLCDVQPLSVTCVPAVDAGDLTGMTCEALCEVDMLAAPPLPGP